LKEQASANADTAAYGQIWVKDDAPNTLWFTDDAGNDLQLGQAPVKATGAEVDTGTDDAKFATAKAIKDSHNVPSVLPSTDGNVLTSNGTDWISEAPAGGGGDMVLASVQSVTGLKTFDKDKAAMKGTSTGVNTISVANISSTSYTNTIPAKTGTFAMTSDLHNALTIGTANGLSLSTQALSLAAASTSVTGALTNTDWNTFNEKQAALVSGTNIKTINSTSLLGSGDISTVQTTITGNAGTATKLATTRAIYGNNFDGSAALTQIIASTYGGTGNGFTKFTGATTAERTYTLPDASSTLLYSGGALGTPSGGTATNITGLPLTGLVDDTTTALGVGTLELGHASDTTLARSAAGVLMVENVVIPSISSTNTLTNKAITKRVATTANDATAVIDVDSYDEYYLTAMSAATTISITGTPVAGQTVFIGLLDDGTTRALTWTGISSFGSVTLPTTTTVSKQHIIGIKYVGAAWIAIAADTAV